MCPLIILNLNRFEDRNIVEGLSCHFPVTECCNGKIQRQFSSDEDVTDGTRCQTLRHPIWTAFLTEYRPAPVPLCHLQLSRRESAVNHRPKSLTKSRVCGQAVPQILRGDVSHALQEVTSAMHGMLPFVLQHLFIVLITCAKMCICLLNMVLTVLLFANYLL